MKMSVKLSRPQIRDLLKLHRSGEALNVPTGMSLYKMGLVRIVKLPGEKGRKYSLTSKALSMLG